MTTIAFGPESASEGEMYLASIFSCFGLSLHLFWDFLLPQRFKVVNNIVCCEWDVYCDFGVGLF